MQVSTEHLQALYRSMGDDELLDHVQGLPLTAEAAALLRAELDRRHLAMPEHAREEDESAEQAAAALFDLDSRPLTLARYLNVVEARIHCALLQSEGIAASLADVHTAVTDNYIFHAIGGVRLMVPANQLDAAQQIINEVRRGWRNLDDAYYDSLPPVPVDTVEPDREQLLLTSILLLTGVGLLTLFLLAG